MAGAIQSTPLFSCLENIVLEPYLEGAERVNRAFNGVNLHHIYHPAINVLTRIWTFLVGASLMIPCINCVIWIFMKTFRNPEELHEDASPPPPVFFLNPIQPPSENLADGLQTEPIQPPSADDQSNRPQTEEMFTYKERSQGQSFQSFFSIQTYEEEHIVTKEDGENVSTSSYDRNWNQKIFSYKNVETDVSIEKKDNLLITNGIHQRELIHKVFALDPRYPWIQQPTVGFRPFLLSNEKKLTFCGINPIDPMNLELDQFTASKEEDTLDVHGPVIKLSIKFTGFKTLLGRICECWFDDKTHELIQMKYCVKILGITYFEGETKRI